MEEMKEIKLPEGVDRISVKQHDDKIVIEFIPEEPKFKEGDFLMNDYRLAFILDREGGDGEAYYLFCTDMDGEIQSHMQDRKEGVRHCGYLKHAVLADGEATEAINGGLKSIGKRWNADKKCIEDIPKRKFKVGDKVRIKDGISNKTHERVSPGFTSTMDKFIGKELTVKEYRGGFAVISENYYRYYFNEDWLEPWSDEPKVGDWVIAWNNDMSLAVIGVKINATPMQACKHVLNNNNSYKHAIKFEPKEQFEKVLRGEI